MDEVDIKIGDKDYAFPVVVGTEGEKAIDITSLRASTGFITLDDGFQNTGSCKSSITFIDGEKGILRYRGYPIEELTEKSTFIETAYLIITGNLPTEAELGGFSEMLNEHSMLNQNMLDFFNGLPPNAHPMATLSTVVNALSMYYPSLFIEDRKTESFMRLAAQMISKIRTIAAFSYKKEIGEPFVYPRYDLKYGENFLNMMFSSTIHPYEIDDDIVKALNLILICHADHEQNCSTATIRLVGSSKVNLFSSICAAICALWGPLHGGANQSVIEMLENIHSNGWTIKQCIDWAKDKDNKFVLSGFGHRIYRNYDPRAKILKRTCETILAKQRIRDPLFDIAMQLEEIALKDDYFISRKLYPNVDFYSGIIYRAIGIPKDMLTVMFAIGRMPGWIAHWKEMHETEPQKIGRPRQVYTGETIRNYMPIWSRGIEDESP